MAEVNDLFKNIDWGTVVAQDDFDDEIKALRGDYKGEVKRFNYVESFNFYGVSIRITETVKGDKGDNRYVDKTFNLGESQYQTEDEGKDKLLVALKTIGVASPDEAVGKTICIKVRPNGTKKDKSGWPKHIVTIVKEFKGATDDANVTEGGTSSILF